MKVTTLRRRVRMWQVRSHLTDWTIAVTMVSKLKVGRRKCHAATSVSVVDQRADIEFDTETVNKAETEWLDHIICHELQHIVNDAEDTALSEFLGGRNKSKVYDAWADANEKTCDHNAAIIVASYRRKLHRPK